MTPLVCQHCGDPKRPVNRPRGLCWKCYYTPGVQDLYGAKCKVFAAPDSSLADSAPDPPTPEMLDIGERVAAYAKRAAAGLPLFTQGEPIVEPKGAICMGCGISTTRRNHLGRIGWHVRPTKIYGGIVRDIVCPKCFAEYGWWAEGGWAAVFRHLATHGKNRPMKPTGAEAE